MSGAVVDYCHNLGIEPNSRFGARGEIAFFSFELVMFVVLVASVITFFCCQKLAFKAME